MYGGKTRDKNGPIENKISKQIATHDHEEETPDCGLKLASNEGSLIGHPLSVLEHPTYLRPTLTLFEGKSR